MAPEGGTLAQQRDETSKGPVLVEGGRLFDPGAGLDRVGDVLIVGGRIVALGAVPQRQILDLPAPPARVDATGRLVVPGLVDIHVHFREPGFEESETVATGSRSALAGGFTSVVCMANTSPVNDRPEVTRRILERASAEGGARVYPISCITRDMSGEELVDFEGQRDAGAVAFSDDGRPVPSERVMEAALRRAADLEAVIVSHCEVLELASGGCMHRGTVSEALGVPGIPREAEWRMVERDARLSWKTGGRMHICHVSVRESVDAIRRAKEDGAPVTAEVAPHHLTLTEECLRDRDPLYKMNPPLRTPDDVEACLEGLTDGTLDAIASDHAPHADRLKAKGLEKAPFGIIGLESTLPVVVSDLVGSGRLSLERAVGALTRAGSSILGLPGGRLERGGPADLAVLDLDEEYVLDVARFRSKSRNCPWGGRRVRGRAIAVVVGGRLFRPEDLPPGRS
jgi:dihydroorotase